MFMRTIGSAFAVSLALALPLAPRAQAQQPETTGKQRLTFEDSRKRISFEGDAPTARWVGEGAALAIVRDGKNVVIDARTGEVLTDVAASPARADASGRRPGPARVPGRTVLVHEDALWLDEASGDAAPRRGRRGPRGPRRLSKAAKKLLDLDPARGAVREVHLSGDGAHASYIQNNDLFVVSTDGSGAWRVTDDGGDERFHGALDWVYQEELYGRGDFQAHWWSPNGGRVAFLSLDEAPVREFTVVDHVPPRFLDEERVVRTEITNYPKAGDPNPFASLSIAHAGPQKVVPVDLSRFPKDLLVVRVDWTPDGETLLVTVQDRIQTWAELCAVDPETGALTTWIREESPTWVNRPRSPQWLDDGTFLWLSERTGYQHVYRYEKGGKLLQTATSGEWQVRSIVEVDEQAQQLWFEGTKDGATGRHLYRVGFDGEGLVCLTPGVGTHSFSLNEDRSLVLDRWSSMEHPTKVRVLDGATGEVVRELGEADKGDADKYEFAEKKRLSIAARDGYELDASVQLPADWQEGQRYPVYLPTYSGPNAPSVRDRWSHSSFDQFLCQQGFVILQVNVRSASGRGMAHTGTCYQRLGVQELQDLEDAVAHVCSEFGGDPERVAISGWSYGGFMSAYALTHSKKFALGIAGAGVHDWRLYDTIYTERYMRTPQENSKGYDETSVIKAAKDLHGHLVLLHGTMDDNVHMQNTMQLIWELQKAGKQNFELMVYPRSRHGLAREVSAHRSEFTWLRLQRLLQQ